MNYKIISHKNKYKIEPEFTAEELKSWLPLEVGIAEIEFRGDKSFTIVNEKLYMYIWKDTIDKSGHYQAWSCYNSDTRRWEQCEDPTYKGNAK